MCKADVIGFAVLPSEGVVTVYRVAVIMGARGISWMAYGLMVS